MTAPGPPAFGAVVAGDGAVFRVWAPAARTVAVAIETGHAAGEYAMTAGADGLFETRVAGVAAGDRYRYRVDGGAPLPDPASRFQPLGVHGPSEVIDPRAYDWRDAAWGGIDPGRAIVYELHVGTFAPEGTFAGAAARLPYLRDLGVTAVELMPVADFAGDRNWGYDGVALFAPARCYGRPDDLRRLVDTAHGLGLAVHLDVVYNHFGPDGAYMSAFAPMYFTSRHPSPWGDGVNLDGAGSRFVRGFIIANALHWIEEYHIDGLRLDATHALQDDSPTHLVAELAGAVRAHGPSHVMIVAEDHRNMASMLVSRDRGGWGLDGVWADDFHHIVRRILAGDAEGYYEDYRDSVADLALTLRQGWFYTGQPSRHLGGPRGSATEGIPRRKFIICTQNHDQIGNRAFGDRLSHRVDLAAYRAAQAVLLLAPETPLLFMGQEWAASTPFLFFTDHHPGLAAAIVNGRRREFAGFREFHDPEVRERIPDPQSPDTFEASRLRWEERAREPHRGMLALHRELIALRARDLPPEGADRTAFAADALDADTVLLRHECRSATLWIAARLRGSGEVRVPGLDAGAVPLLTTEDPAFAESGRPPEVDVRSARIRFPGPAAVIMVRE